MLSRTVFNLFVRRFCCWKSKTTLSRIIWKRSSLFWIQCNVISRVWMRRIRSFRFKLLKLKWKSSNYVNSLFKLRMMLKTLVRGLIWCKTVNCSKLSVNSQCWKALNSNTLNKCKLKTLNSINWVNNFKK